MQFDNGSPIWLQLVAEFSRRIVVGDWEPGSRVPGVRELAAGLGVNPNTAQRALAELERQGLCHSERTAGRFVTEDPTQIEALRVELAREAADDFITRARGFGMALAQAQQLLHDRWEHDDDRDPSPTRTEGR